ncbi:carboxypeptidase regulatory-like domain-containing protein [Burkholderia ubonensis]|uniref:Carboxypeptidase regulatory-like domain-containing protein n=1 Tax=Burkholderia ubonensis TaxID=101571 RepID=A0AAW3N2X1_9BURK|nr:carboxypeptidase regulatory-like domain-containing protein [Burkholderia ubonensis]KVT41294.1 hypothetical protein WK53_19715 [Burkholderia ubonensis]
MSIWIVRVLLASICMLSIGTDAPAQPQSSPVQVGRTGIAYMTGGIGADDVSAFRAAAPRYNLRITLASAAGEYLSDVDVTILSGTTPLLDVRTAGPFLFARMPPGRYKVVARDSRTLEIRHVVVPARGGVDVRFYWDAPDLGDVAHRCPECAKMQPHSID